MRASIWQQKSDCMSATRLVTCGVHVTPFRFTDCKDTRKIGSANSKDAEDAVQVHLLYHLCELGHTRHFNVTDMQQSKECVDTDVGIS